MASSGANPWKASSSSDNGPSRDAHSFPPLGAKGPSKSQRRAKALYTQSAPFQPYPPRLEQLTRQELSRLEMECEQEVEDECGGEEGEEMGQATYPQRSGMSSVTVYDEDGNQLSRGPDIYRRAASARSRRGVQRDNEKEKVGERIGASSKEREGGKASTPVATSTSTQPVPLPFTDARLDALSRECQRRERVQAAETRVEGGRPVQEDAYEPLKQQVLLAFSSLDGFLAAFGKEAVGEGERDCI